MVGAETAEYLAAQGKQVTLVEMMDSIATDMHRTSRLLLMFSFEDLGVKILTKATVKAINDKGVSIDYIGKEKFLEADTVVLAIGSQQDRALSEQLAKLKIEYYDVGDCAQPRMLPDATLEGFNAALKVE